MNIDDDVEMWFMYDDNGPLVIKYGNAESHKVYHYELNLQGDIIAIVSTTGERVVEYTYDAWGNVLSITGSAANTIGVNNPLRYRGYIYDPETQLYYCQSRYYNPEVGRWLNADTFAATGQGLLGNNMFAYCGNNPVNYHDPTGTKLTSTEIHNAVVKDICNKNPGKTNQSTKMLYYAVYFGMDYGFCDIYDVNTHEVWDVKRFGNGTGCKPSQAQRQLTNYVNNGYLKENPTWKMVKGGTVTTIPASVVFVRDSVDHCTYVVAYWDAGVYNSLDGIIYYDYIVINDPDVKEASTSLAGILALAGLGYLAQSVCVTDSPGIRNPLPGH